MSALAGRRLTTELLDHLPAADPSAIKSRRDLRHVNALMFNAPILTRRLQRDLPRPPKRILDIGCGDGSFMLAVARRMHRSWPEAEVLLLDRQDLVAPDDLSRFAALGWRAETVSADALEWLARREAGFDLVTANLFLHHFEGDQLSQLLGGVHRRASSFVATEPRRHMAALLSARLLRAIGANAVTIHDAAASVQAGFAGTELSAIWPGDVVVERDVGPFTHVFSAKGAG